MKHILENNLGSKGSLVMKFVKFMQYYKIIKKKKKILQKIFCKKRFCGGQHDSDKF